MQTLGNITIYVLLYIVVYSLVGVFIDTSLIKTSDLRFMIVNLSVVVLIYVGLTIYERIVYESHVRIMTSRRGFNPVSILWGVFLLLSVYVVLSPLDAYLPVDDRVFPEGGWTLFATIIVAPIFEELIYRGRLISMFRQTCSPSGAILLSAFIFAVAHGSLIVGINAFIAGVILGYFYYMRGSIFAPIILHICNNVLGYAMMELTYNDMSASDLIKSSPIFVIVYAISAAISFIGLVHIVHTLSRADYRTMRLENREVELDRQMEEVENTGVSVDLQGDDVKYDDSED